MPRKRPLEVRLAEAEEDVKRLRDEMRMVELRRRINARRPRRRRPR